MTNNGTLGVGVAQISLSARSTYICRELEEYIKIAGDAENCGGLGLLETDAPNPMQLRYDATSSSG